MHLCTFVFTAAAITIYKEKKSVAVVDSCPGSVIVGILLDIIVLVVEVGVVIESGFILR